MYVCNRITLLYSKNQQHLPSGSDNKESACNAGDLGSVPWSGRSPGGGYGDPLQFSCLENPMDRRGWQATVHRIAQSQTQLKRLSTQRKSTILQLKKLKLFFKGMIPIFFLKGCYPSRPALEGNGNPLQCSCLENPRDGGAWWAAVYGVAQSRTRLKRLSSRPALENIFFPIHQEKSHVWQFDGGCPKYLLRGDAVMYGRPL